MNQTSDCLADHPVVGYVAGEPQKTNIVYCQQCKHIRRDETITTGTPPPGEPLDAYCDHEKNVISKSFDTWFQNVKDVKHKREPSEINKNNDCVWHEPTNTFVGTKAL